jgi:hypothetical protein
MKRILVCLALAATASARQPVAAYYDDMHYSVTYFIARECGFTPLQARRVASANLSVDYSALSEPEQRDRLKPNEPTYNLSAQEPRVFFHAMRDERVPSKDVQVSDAAVRRQSEILLELGYRERNPGVYLHFLQDMRPHAGYSSWGGHWFPPSTPRHPDPHVAAPNLWYGAYTDYLSFDPDKARATVADTARVLRTFMSKMAPLQRPGACDQGRMDALLRDVMRRNPSAQRSPPDYEAAHPVIRSALANDMQAYVSSRIDYTYSGAGRVGRRSAKGVVADPSASDNFTLYGDLNVQLRGTESDTRAVQVSVWAEPTTSSVDDRPYQLACRESSLDSEDIANLPVGNLFVQVVSAAGGVTRSRFVLTKMDQTVVVTVPRKSAAITKCEAPLASAARDLCRFAGQEPGPAGSFDLAAARRIEARVQEEWERAQSCRDSGETTAARPPRRGTNSGRPSANAAQRSGLSLSPAQCVRVSELEVALQAMNACRDSAPGQPQVVASCRQWWGNNFLCRFPPTCTAAVDRYYGLLTGTFGQANMRSMPRAGGAARPEAINGLIRNACQGGGPLTP